MSQQKKEESVSCQNQIFISRKFFRENLLATEMKQNLILENKSVYLDFSILELSKILIIYEFWYDYVKPKYVKKSKLCYMIIFSFILYIKRDNAYKDIEFFFFFKSKTYSYLIDDDS